MCLNPCVQLSERVPPRVLVDGVDLETHERAAGSLESSERAETRRVGWRGELEGA